MADLDLLRWYVEQVEESHQDQGILVSTVVYGCGFVVDKQVKTATESDPRPDPPKWRYCRWWTSWEPACQCLMQAVTPYVQDVRICMALLEVCAVKTEATESEDSRSQDGYRRW